MILRYLLFIVLVALALFFSTGLQFFLEQFVQDWMLSPQETVIV